MTCGKRARLIIGVSHNKGHQLAFLWLRDCGRSCCQKSSLVTNLELHGGKIVSTGMEGMLWNKSLKTRLCHNLLAASVCRTFERVTCSRPCRDVFVEQGFQALLSCLCKARLQFQFELWETQTRIGRRLCSCCVSHLSSISQSNVRYCFTQQRVFSKAVGDEFHSCFTVQTQGVTPGLQLEIVRIHAKVCLLCFRKIHGHRPKFGGVRGYVI